MVIERERAMCFTFSFDRRFSCALVARRAFSSTRHSAASFNCTLEADFETAEPANGPVAAAAATATVAALPRPEPFQVSYSANLKWNEPDDAPYVRRLHGRVLIESRETGQKHLRNDA